MTPVSPRPATLQDLDQVIELLWAVAAEGRWLGTEVPFDRAVHRQSLAELIGRPEAALLVAEAGGPTGVVGYISLEVARYGVANLHLLITEGWRGRGLGRALLEAGLAWAAGAGAHKAALEVWPDNEAALALYRRAGFVEEGRKRRHYRRANGDLWDAVLMGRPLIEPNPCQPGS
ncbi:MAG: GNAT family N-acetyltransferase, partial [Acidimicrobiales bacterium]